MLGEGRACLDTHLIRWVAPNNTSAAYPGLSILLLKCYVEGVMCIFVMVCIHACVSPHSQLRTSTSTSLPAASVVVGSKPIIEPVKESAPVPDEEEMIGVYARSKRAGERMVRAMNCHVLKTVVVRPGGIFGAGDTVSKSLASSSGFVLVF